MKKTPKSTLKSFANCRVAIVMGSHSDLKIMESAAHRLQQLKIPFDIKIVSAHRTPETMVAFAKEASDKYDVIIAGAGGAAHLPGMIASLTIRPVIGVPVTTTKLKGLDSLLSIVQMPSGVPVATVAIDNADNAGILAARILGTKYPSIEKILKKLQKEQEKKVRSMNQTLRRSLRAPWPSSPRQRQSSK